MVIFNAFMKDDLGYCGAKPALQRGLVLCLVAPGWKLVGL